MSLGVAAPRVTSAGSTSAGRAVLALQGLLTTANRYYLTQRRVVYALLHEGTARQVRAPDAERANEADETRVSCRWARFAGRRH